MTDSFVKKLANSEIENSLANKLRLRRFRFFEELCNTLQKPIKILDVGGTIDYWEKMRFINREGVFITILNLQKEDVNYKNFSSVTGDARNLSEFKDKEFDVVFSNSVIEHVGSFEDQRKMAREIQRVGRYFYVQTPNYYFPLEPHFFFPFFQMLPVKIRIFLLMNLRLGWSGRKYSDREEALKAAT